MNEKKLINSEKELVQRIVNLFQKKDYSIWLEVPNMGQSVDIVASKNENLTFIEVKMSNWRRALAQCEGHGMVADYIYIAISSVQISNEFYNTSKNLGYGIIHCNPYTMQCSKVLQAKKNTCIWAPQQKVLKGNMQEVSLCL